MRSDIRVVGNEIRFDGVPVAVLSPENHKDPLARDMRAEFVRWLQAHSRLISPALFTSDNGKI